MATPKKSGPKVASPEGPSHQSIAVRAYDLFIQRGSAHGWDLDDWLRAEGELRGENKDKAPKLKKTRSVKPVA
jgi:hypothetical protein